MLILPDYDGIIPLEERMVNRLRTEMLAAMKE